MKSEIQSLSSNIEIKQREIVSLQQEISKFKRISHVKETFAMLDPDTNGMLSTKALVHRLSGQPRFEMDYKLNLANFVNLICESLIASENDEEKNMYWNSCYMPFREISTPTDDGKPKQPPFLGRIEDPYYQRIIEKIKTYTLR